VRDKDLIAAILNGDRTAGDQLARRYYTQLYAYFAPRIGREDARDLTQLTLMHTVVRVHRFRAESTFRHYVFAVARRALSEHYRRCKRSVETVPLGSEPAASQTTPSERVFKVECHAAIMRTVAALADHYRLVVSMHLDGADNFEIAQTLNIEYNTVRSRLSRGLARIKARLKPWARELINPPRILSAIETSSSVA
jgi:RNA polymerase sigma-70 factor, ECF subfamily